MNTEINNGAESGSVNRLVRLLATDYAADYELQPQAESECDNTFKHRVAGQLRDAGHIIEAHEVQANARHDDEGGNAIAGIMGAMSMALSGRGYGSRGSSQVGDEMAVGMLVQHEMSPAGKRERAADAALASMLTMGLDPDAIRALSV